MSYLVFVSDLHGNLVLFEKLFEAIRSERPWAVLIGGAYIQPPLIFGNEASRSLGLLNAS